MNKLLRAYFGFAMGLLLITAIAKLITVVQGPPVVRLKDAVFVFLDHRQMLVSMAILEIGIATVLLVVHDPIIKLRIVIGFCSAILLYRICRVWLDVQEPCGCLGYPGDWLRLKQNLMEWTLVALVAALLSGGAALRVGLGNPRRLPSGLAYYPPVEPVVCAGSQGGGALPGQKVVRRKEEALDSSAPSTR